jgi:hypothetical protein
LGTRVEDFLTEPGKDFCFVETVFPVQVGNRDFAPDQRNSKSFVVFAS